VIHSSGFPATRGRNVPLPRAKDPSGSTIARIVDNGKDIRGRVIGGREPSTTSVQYSLSNVRCTPRRDDHERVGRKKVRTLAVSPIGTFAQTLRRVARVTPVARGAHPHHRPAAVTDAVRVAVHEHADRDLHPEKYLP
jgi:hypothetical protein